MDNWQSAFLDELINDPGQDEDEEDSDCEMEDDSAGQDVIYTKDKIIQGSYYGP